MQVTTINMITLYEEFSDYLGLTIDQDPTQKDFPRFIRFLEERYGCPDLAFEFWNDMGMNIPL